MSPPVIPLARRGERPTRRASPACPEPLGDPVGSFKGTQVHFDDVFRVNYRKADSTGVATDDEKEANWFAAVLLMPEHFLRKDWLRLRLENHAALGAIQSLAVRYKVSPKAMELRLVNLGFVSPVAE